MAGVRRGRHLGNGFIDVGAPLDEATPRERQALKDNKLRNISRATADRRAVAFRSVEREGPAPTNGDGHGRTVSARVLRQPSLGADGPLGPASKAYRRKQLSGLY